MIEGIEEVIYVGMEEVTEDGSNLAPTHELPGPRGLLGRNTCSGVRIESHNSAVPRLDHLRISENSGILVHDQYL